MADEVSEIRSRVDLVALVGQRVALKRVGKNWKGLCPFHQDKNPSFYVSPGIGRYRCFACGESGDAFNWVMKTQNVDFPEALESLARLTGVQLSGRKPQDRSERQRQAAAMHAAVGFFRSSLKASTSATEYCQKRGLDSATLDAWEIGFAPDVGEALAVHLKREGHSLTECASLFLVERDASGGYFDKFRGRLMFPIRDDKGELVAFGGRLLGDGHPKYINSGDTPLFRKSRVLYGFGRAKQTISEKRQAVLVEGYLDVIACHQAGVTQAVASLGTSLTEEQAELLKRWCDEAVVLYDADDAGQKAADKAHDTLKAVGLKTRFAIMSKGQDPDTLLRELGPAAVQKAVEDALPPVDFRLRRLQLRLDPKDEEFWEDAFRLLAESSNDLEVERHVAHLAGIFPGIRDPAAAQRSIRNQVRRLKREGQAHRPGTQHVAYRFERLKLSSSERTLLLALLQPELCPAVWAALSEPDLMETENGMQMATAIRTSFPDGVPIDPPSVWMAAIQPDDFRERYADLVIEHQAKAHAGQVPETMPEDYLLDALRALRAKKDQRLLAELKQGDMDDEKLREISRRLKNLHRPYP